MQPDPTNLIERIGLTTPLIGFYDSPDPAPFAPLVKPGLGKGTCASTGSGSRERRSTSPNATLAAVELVTGSATSRPDRERALSGFSWMTRG